MKKVISILIAGIMLVGITGTADATLMTWSSNTTAQGKKGTYTIKHDLATFNQKTDTIASYNLTIDNQTVFLSSKQQKSLFSTGQVSFKYQYSNGAKYINTKLWAQGDRTGGGGNGVPEPGMLALMALVLLGLGLGPWLRKIQTKRLPEE